MKLADARAEFRARSPLEAVDFGAHLLRAHAPALARALLVFSIAPTFAVVLALALLEVPALAAFVVFWLRPLDARITLLVVSRGLFGDAPSLRETGRLLVTEGRRGLLWDLTFGRLSVVRSLALPVTLLEDLPRARRRARVALITRDLGGVAAGLAFAALCLSLILAGSGASLIEQAGQLDQLVRPGSVDDLFVDSGRPDGASRVTIFVLFYALSAPLGEALHATSGFALYLNRRTLAEGWDIELTFRRLAARVSGIVALVLALAWPPAARAETPPDDQGSAAATASLLEEIAITDARHERARREVEAVLARPEFGQETVRESYEPRFRVEDQGAATGEPDLAFFAALGEVLRWFILILLGIGVVLLLARLFTRRKRGDARAPAAARRRAEVREIPGETRAPEGDLARRARQLAREGRALEALGLLYRGGIEELSSRHAIDLARGATEGECVRAVRRHAPDEEASRFATLTRAWQLAAYRGAAPDATELERLVELALPLLGGRA